MSDYAGFSKVKLTKPSKSTFDLTHDVRTSAFMGHLTPILCMETVPSDVFRGSSEVLLRLAPLLAPIYDQIEVFVHYFFVPNRLLWDEWEEFITGGRLGVGVDPVTAPVVPQVDIFDTLTFAATVFEENSLADYLGVPLLPMDGAAATYDGLTLDLMPFAAYYKVWEDYYRDRNFIDDDPVLPLASGIAVVADVAQLFTVRVRNYKHDYFTSALPFTQRGEDVLIPLDGSVTYLDQSRMIRSDTDLPLTNDGFVGGNIGSAVPGGLFLNKQNLADDGVAGRIENIDTISNISTTINDFRSAYALQVWLERNAVGGSRYTESTQAHFGVRPQDSRLQRPEYIGGGRIPVRISEVVATANSANADDDVVPQGNMAGHGVSYGDTNRFNYFCPEHGFIIGILSVMNPPSYHQGIPRMFRRRSFLDYPWPTFAKLGEQVVYRYEIFGSAANLTEDVDTDEPPIFGYQSRYADWKHIANTNRGSFHSSLLFWTLTRDFAASPDLGASFVEFDTASQGRIFAVDPFGTDPFTPPLWLYIHNKIMAKRPLPYFGTPNALGFV